ncbi:MAG: cytochrome c biogenesis heme-transporting ATPase CcmA [Halioglobus sp.]
MSSATAGETLLAAQSLSLERGGRQLFDGLSFAVCAGQLIQVDGANGAGKTSLLRILAGLSRYGFEGNITRQSSLLYLGHQAGVKQLLTPRENLAWHAAGEGEYANADIEQALAHVGLTGYEDVSSHTLSAGQHRRVNLARLYLSSSPLWLLDEPFAAIDQKGVAELERLMVKHVSAGGAVIITSHQSLQVSYPLSRLSLSAGLQ